MTWCCMCLLCTIQKLRVVSDSSLAHLCVSQSGCPGKPHTDQLASSWAANPGTVSSCCVHKPSPAASSGGYPPRPSHSRSIRTSPNVSTAVLYTSMQDSTDFLCLQLCQGLYKFELLVNKYSPLFTYFTLKVALF